MSSGPSTNDSGAASPIDLRSAKKRKRTRWIIAAVLFSLVGLTTLEKYFLQKQTSTPIANDIAVLAVFNIILILLFILVVLITRNLVKLYNERKSKIIGSKFQTKLIIAFLILALLPSTLLFIVASKLFTYSIGSWFNLQVEQSLKQSMQVAREYYEHLEKGAVQQAKQIEGFITRDELYLQKMRDQLNELARQKVDEYQLGGLVLLDDKSQVVVSRFYKSLGPKGIKINYEELIQKSVGGEGITEIKASRRGNFLTVVAPLQELVEDKKITWGYIVTLTHIPKKTLKKIAAIKTTFQDYKQQKFLALPVSASYYTTFFMVTLLVLFSAIWLGFYMAKGITVPIQQLAEGTRRISGGDLNFKIGVRADDEIGILVNSFNQMTDQLNESRQNTQRAHEDLKATNIELERRRRYIETILQHIGAGVISVNKKGIVTTFNKAAEKILKANPKHVFGTSYKDAFPNSFHDPMRKMIKRMNEHKQEVVEEQIELRAGDANLTLLVHAQVLRDDADKYLGIVIVFEDLTQMIKTQKIAAWKEVAQGIAHEIKNPLTPIQLNTQRLLKKYYEDKPGFDRVFDESISIISQEVEGMKDLLNEFQRFARMPAPNPRPYSLHKIIDDISTLYGDPARKLNIVKNLDPHIEMMSLDGEQIRRVFINLFENAIDAINGNGRIEIDTSLDTGKNNVVIKFSDNGTGIPHDLHDKLFLPHFTTKKRGSGLGLAIVNRIIVDHNGSIQVKDNQPKGTVFIIEIPYLSFPSKAGSQILESKPEPSSTPI